MQTDLNDRRIILQGGVATAGAILSGTTPAHAARRRRAGKIETAMASLCCDGFADLDFKYAFDYAPKLGIRNIEFNTWYPRNLTEAGVESIKRRCRRNRLRPISVQVSSFSAVGHGGVTREVSRMMWLIEVCRRLGCKIIKATGVKRGEGGGLPAIIDIMKESAPAAEEAGVTFMLENHKNNNLEFTEDYETIFEAIDSTAVAVCFDMGHFAASSVDMDDFIERFHTRIKHIDVKDNIADGKKGFVRYGKGTVDVDGLIKKCVDRGFTGYLVLELSLREHATVLDDLRAGLAITRKYER